MENNDKKNQTDLDPAIKNKGDNQKAGYGGRDLPNSKEVHKNSNEEEE